MIDDLDGRDGDDEASSSSPFVRQWAERSHCESASGSSSPGSGSGLRSRKRSFHRRSATTADCVYHHPLLGHSTIHDCAITRPSLTRWLGHGAPDSVTTRDESTDSREGDGLNAGESETLVIVHKVSRSDSLPGIALKYGISLADLRKANQLWASDPVQLRQVLYIPIHLTSVKRNIRPDALVDGQSHIGDESAVLQRVPASQLAFFRRSSQSRRHAEAEASKRELNLSSPLSPAFSSTTPSHRLSYLFHGLSSFSSDFARLSLEASESTSTANHSHSEASTSDQEHEMSVLKPRPRTSSSVRRKAALLQKKPSPVTPDFPKKRFSALDLHVYQSPVRTEQMRPSPRMEFPHAKSYG